MLLGKWGRHHALSSLRATVRWDSFSSPSAPSDVQDTTPAKAGVVFKAGEAIRTPDIHVGNRLVSDQKRALRVSSGVHPMRLLQLLHVNA